MDLNLQNKVAVVTGGSGELGRTISRTLAACGAHVAITYLRNRENADAVTADIRALGRKAIAVKTDVAKKAEVEALRATVTRELGQANIIVNNAVSQIPWKSVLEQTSENYEDQFRSNVLHNVHMAQAFAPAMVEKKWGRIIAINTECAMQNLPSQSAYVSGKRGMDGVLRVLAREIGASGVTVNQVAPGWMISDKDRNGGRESNPEYEKNVPLKHRGTDQDVANAVAFLASDLAAFITGVYLPVCGGNVMPSI